MANLYMRRFVLRWKKFGLEHTLGTRIENYADDLVILCRKSTADEALRAFARARFRSQGQSENSRSPRAMSVQEERGHALSSSE
jgi:hypothetical protein